MINDVELDRLRIRNLLENWIIWRDSGEWARFATLWHEGARMNATWFRASAAEFIEGCRKGFEAGMIAAHSLGASSIDIEGDRAVAQSRMSIIQRGMIDDIEVDVTCVGRFVDALEKRQGRWGLVLRQPVYEFDSMSVVDPAASLALDKNILERFPVGYRHLAYLQTKMGFTVGTSLPGTRGPEIEALGARMARWLAGDNASCLVQDS